MHTCTQYIYSHARITCTLTMHKRIIIFCIYICIRAITRPSDKARSPHTTRRLSRRGQVHRNNQHIHILLNPYIYTYKRYTLTAWKSSSKQPTNTLKYPTNTLKYVYLNSQHVSIHTQSAFNYAINKQNKNRRRRSGHCHRTHTIRPDPRTSSPH